MKSAVSLFVYFPPTLPWAVSSGRSPCHYYAPTSFTSLSTDGTHQYAIAVDVSCIKTQTKTLLLKQTAELGDEIF